MRSSIDAAAADIIALAARHAGFRTTVTDSAGLTAIGQLRSLEEKEEPAAIIIVSAGGNDAQYVPYLARRADDAAANVLSFEAGAEIVSTAREAEREIRYNKLCDLIQQLRYTPSAKPEEIITPAETEPV